MIKSKFNFIIQGTWNLFIGVGSRFMDGLDLSVLWFIGENRLMMNIARKRITLTHDAICE